MHTPENKPILQVKNLTCERDERLLFENLCFQIHAGEVLQIEGQNGSGKTTLLRILCGLLSNFSGEIFWQGNNISQVQAEYYQALLYVGHLTGVKATLTPLENLAWMQQLSPQLQQLDLETALAKVGLYGFETVPCYSLSAGQQRRVNLARLYLSNAPLWILDEPFTALDITGVTEKEQLIQQHVATGGCVILTTHQELKISQRRLNLDSLRVT